LLSAINYLQSKDITICHRDINPNNIMVSFASEQPHLTLIDFNISTKFTDLTGKPKQMLSDCGTALY